MKKAVAFTLSLLAILIANAQWSNTTNQFDDAFHMPVTQAAGTQQNAIVLKSYPDSGYIVLWEDARTTGNGSDIYAQKYDKAGNALWATGGMAVAASTDNELFAPVTYAGGDARYKGHACTDSAGGFFVAWDADAGNSNNKVVAQHVLADGTLRFAAPGFVVTPRNLNDALYYTEPQLVADGKKGCYIAYVKGNKSGGARDLFVANYLDDNGTMKYNGGGQMDYSAQVQLVLTGCGIVGTLIYPDANIKDYHIYPDGQGGCNAVFAYYINTQANGTVGALGFNQLCRVKKASQVTVRRLTGDLGVVGSSPPYVERYYTYKKDSVVRLYNFTTTSIGKGCPTVAVTDYSIPPGGEGFLQFTMNGQDAEFAKGAIATTDGAANINVNILAASVLPSRTTASNWSKRMVILPQEIYDSLPYQLCSDTTHIGYAYRPEPETPLTKLNAGYDTLLGPASYTDYDFALAASGRRIFAAGRIYGPTSALVPILVKLSQLQVERITTDSLAVQWRTPKGGITIGKEKYSYPGAYYNQPLITTDERGNALFSIVQNERQVLVSPIADGGQLTWSALGRPLGSGYTGTQATQVYAPAVAMSPADGTAVIAWTNLGSFSNTGRDVYLRHLDNLNVYNQLPPQTGVAVLGAGVFANATTLVGLSKTWNYFEGFNTTTAKLSTMSAIYDDYNLGTVTASAYDHPNAVRRYNSLPYLDRNYTITVENQPAAGAAALVRLFFTDAQLAALKAADPSIASPGNLMVIKQPKGSLENPTTYVPVAGEQRIVPTAWAAVEGGYYVQFPVGGFSYFFIMKSNVALPVRWVGLAARREGSNTALVSWQLTNEVNVNNYVVEYSLDGVNYKEGCTVNAGGASAYQCSFAIGSGKYFVRIKQTDRDGKVDYSTTVLIDPIKTDLRFTLAPNPVQGDALLRYAIPAATRVLLRLVTTGGAVVWQQALSLSATGTVAVPTSNLAAGVYTLQIQLNERVERVRMVKE